MIVWVNGAFGAGKTTLAEELSRWLPDAVLFDPESVGYMLRHWVAVPTGDFQDLPSWREPRTSSTSSWTWMDPAVLRQR